MAVALLIALLSWFTLSVSFGLSIGALLSHRNERHHGDGSRAEIRENRMHSGHGARRSHRPPGGRSDVRGGER
jgi:hypothetical protein